MPFFPNNPPPDMDESESISKTSYMDRFESISKTPFMDESESMSKTSEMDESESISKTYDIDESISKRMSCLDMDELRERKVKFTPPYKRFNMDVGCAHTFSFVEIFQIRIDKFDEMERREAYGKVEITDAESSYPLYHRDRENSEHVHSNSTISLTCPSRAIEIVTGFCVTIDLRLSSDGSGLEDVSLGNWQISWDFLDYQIARITHGRFFEDPCDRDDLLSLDTNVRYQPAGYDRPLCAYFEGVNGRCITMYYALFQHAVQVWVQVEVVDMNGDPTVVDYDVHGGITATYSHFVHDNDSNKKDECKITLLKTKDLETIKVERWKKIQLSRCFMAVPVYASFIIEANLCTSSHLKVANGKVEFTPNHFELGYDYIRGDGDIGLRIMVCWSLKPGRPKRNPFD